MLHGLYLDPRVWGIDIGPSVFWNPERFEVKMDFPPTKASRIAKQNIRVNSKYKFVITTSVWEKPIRRTLQHLRRQGLKIFLLPREPFKFGAHESAMFRHPKYKLDGEYFFTPDAVFAPGQNYANFWKDLTATYITGYPRFELYIDNAWASREEVASKYGLEATRKWVFFPDYPPLFSQEFNGKITEVNIDKVRDDSILALEHFAKSTGSHQIVIKLHPQTWKSYSKYDMYVSDLMKFRLDNPSADIKIIPDTWESSTQVARELLVHSDIIAGFASTMLLEAAILNKPVVYMLFGETKDFDGLPDYHQYLPVAYDKDELLNILSKPINCDTASLVNHYLFDVDGQACKRICEAIKGECNGR